LGKAKLVMVVVQNSTLIN